MGRCDASGQVASRARLVLESDIPRGADLPEYVVAKAEVRRPGPVSAVQFQIHLSEGAEVTGMTVDDEPVPWFAFREQGRPAVLVELDLVPRRPTTVVVEFNEPTSDLPGVMPDQPLARPADITIDDVPCPTAQ